MRARVAAGCVGCVWRGSNYEGLMVDALGPRADEGRGKAAKILDEPSNRRSREYPNGETCSGVESVHSVRRGKWGN